MGTGIVIGLIVFCVVTLGVCCFLYDSFRRKLQRLAAVPDVPSKIEGLKQSLTNHLDTLTKVGHKYSTLYVEHLDTVDECKLLTKSNDRLRKESDEAFQKHLNVARIICCQLDLESKDLFHTSGSCRQPVNQKSKSV